jgi:hypothetical protein
MAKREYHLTRQCVGDGCHAVERHTYNTQREYFDAQRQYANRPYHCARHRPENLQPDSGKRHVVITCDHADAIAYPNIQDMHFWSTGSGYAFGPGFNAYAEDFPIGAKIHITISVELPMGE